MIGEVFMDRFRLLERLQQGERLSTYLALDMALQMEVEVDVLEAVLSGLPIPPDRAEEIFDTAMHVRGSHIVTFHGWGEEIDCNRICLVRDRAHGTPLTEILAESAHLPRSQLEELVEAVTEVLAESYGRGLFYLGINPGQVLVGPRGEVMLYRVGFGWLLEEMEPLLAARCSPYRAPETDGGAEGSRTSDIYSLAVMVREMLPREECGGRLQDLLDRCLDPLPKRRPSSPRLLLEELRGDRAGAGEGGGAGGGGGAGDGAGAHDGADGGAGGTAKGGGGKPPSSRGRPRGLRFLEKAALPAPPAPLRGRRAPHLLRVFAVALAGGLALWLLFAAVSGGLTGKGEGREETLGAGSEEKVALPDLEGLTAQEAEKALEELGLAAASREAPSRLWSAGRVTAQEPEEGTLLRKGDTVLLVVSSGRDDALEQVSAGAGEAPDQPPSPADMAAPSPQTSSGSPQASPGPDAPGPGSSPPPPLPPRAVAALSARSGPAPLCLVMDAGGSCDPDGRIVRYLWDCGDGTVLAGPVAKHVFDPAVIPARFQVVLQVFDDDGLSSSSALTVEVY